MTCRDIAGAVIGQGRALDSRALRSNMEAAFGASDAKASSRGGHVQGAAHAVGAPRKNEPKAGRQQGSIGKNA